MSRNILSRIASLPVFCAAVPVVWMLGYEFGRQVAGAAVGRQSSTFGISMFLAILFTPILALAGYGIGYMLRWLIRRILGPDPRPRWLALWRAAVCASLVLIAVVNWYRGAEPIYAADREATPRVIQNSIRLRGTSLAQSGAAVTHATRSWKYAPKVNIPVAWGEYRVSFEPLAEGLKVMFGDGGETLLIPSPGIDYMIAIDAIPVALTRDGTTALAVLVTGRATGRRDLLAVISPERDLQYLELLDRHWDFRTAPLAIAPTPAGDMILVGSDPDRLLAFAL